jgi:hypothetical protein
VKSGGKDFAMFGDATMQMTDNIRIALFPAAASKTMPTSHHRHGSRSVVHRMVRAEPEENQVPILKASNKPHPGLRNEGANLSNALVILVSFC